MSSLQHWKKGRRDEPALLARSLGTTRHCQPHSLSSLPPTIATTSREHPIATPGPNLAVSNIHTRPGPRHPAKSQLLHIKPNLDNTLAWGVASRHPLLTDKHLNHRREGIARLFTTGKLRCQCKSNYACESLGASRCLAQPQFAFLQHRGTPHRKTR